MLTDDQLRLMHGDCLDVLPTLPAKSVHCVVTSPPYWGLRDYGTATWEGGDEGCDHKAASPMPSKRDGEVRRDDRGVPYGPSKKENTSQYRETCGKCGARRIDSQLGLEATPGEYVAKMVRVFREVWRVLRDDGTCWINLGDSYSSGDRSTYRSGASDNKGHQVQDNQPRPKTPPGLKPKDLVGMPWRVALALQADGWYLRSDIIWAKPNPMPESCTDRPTKSHEYMFLLTKQPRYFYDADAIREPHQAASIERFKPEASPASAARRRGEEGLPGGQPHSMRVEQSLHTAGRNKRSVWNIPTQPYPKAHFATFPEALVLPCILAGTSEEGCCAECGAPWERVVDVSYIKSGTGTTGRAMDLKEPDGRTDGTGMGGKPTMSRVNTTTSWKSTCECNADTVPCTVLDPFSGSATVGKVAQQYGRSFIGIELSAEYIKLAQDRFKQERLW